MPGDGLTHCVRLGGWGLETSSYAVGIDRNDAAKPTQKAGEAAAHVQAVSHGERLKAVAVDVARLSNSPSTGRTHCYASFRPTRADYRAPLNNFGPLQDGAAPLRFAIQRTELRRLPTNPRYAVPTLNWIGKDAVVRHHKEVPFRLLEPDRKLSYGDAAAGNLIVEGDNLHALKALLPRYAGKVKCICIDPPYNTGNEGWVYNDNVNAPEILRWLGSGGGFLPNGGSLTETADLGRVKLGGRKLFGAATFLSWANGVRKDGACGVVSFSIHWLVGEDAHAPWAFIRLRSPSYAGQCIAPPWGGIARDVGERGRWFGFGHEG